jgi:hypothetical protein
MAKRVCGAVMALGMTMGAASAATPADPTEPAFRALYQELVGLGLISKQYHSPSGCVGWAATGLPGALGNKKTRISAGLVPSPGCPETAWNPVVVPEVGLEPTRF